MILSRILRIKRIRPKESKNTLVLLDPLSRPLSGRPCGIDRAVRRREVILTTLIVVIAVVVVVAVAVPVAAMVVVEPRGSLPPTNSRSFQSQKVPGAGAVRARPKMLPPPHRLAKSLFSVEPTYIVPFSIIILLA